VHRVFPEINNFGFQELIRLVLQFRLFYNALKPFLSRQVHFSNHTLSKRVVRHYLTNSYQK